MQVMEVIRWFHGSNNVVSRFECFFCPELVLVGLELEPQQIKREKTAKCKSIALSCLFKWDKKVNFGKVVPNTGVFDAFVFVEDF